MLFVRTLSEVFQVRTPLLLGGRLNCWGRFNQRSYSTAIRVEDYSVKRSLCEAKPEAQNEKIPTYQQIKNDTKLQERLANMYQSQNSDPEFQELTIESMKWGVRSLGKEKQ